MLFTLWGGEAYRATGDLDLLGYDSPEPSVPRSLGGGKPSSYNDLGRLSERRNVGRGSTPAEKRA